MRECSTEATREVSSLLSELIDRGLDAQPMRLWVIDGELRKAILETFGALALIQRCQEQKRRNVVEHLPEDMHVSVNRALRNAWSSHDDKLARKQLMRLVTSLRARRPGRRSQPARRPGGHLDARRASRYFVASFMQPTASLSITVFCCWQAANVWVRCRQRETVRRTASMQHRSAPIWRATRNMRRYSRIGAKTGGVTRFWFPYLRNVQCVP